MLQLYAIMQAPSSAMPIEGVEVLQHAELCAAYTRMNAAPAIGLAGLRQHDRVVRALCSASAAVLPARFGQSVASEAALTAYLRRTETELMQALAHVSGCVQMTVRFADAAAIEPLPAASGKEYLQARWKQDRRRRAIGEALGARVGHLVREARIDESRRVRHLASVYHLVPWTNVEAYQHSLGDHPVDGVSWQLSGPAPVYAFAARMPG